MDALLYRRVQYGIAPVNIGNMTMARTKNVGAVAVAEVAEVTAVAEPVVVKTAAELIAQYGNKSKAIRALNGEGHKTGEIAKMLGIRYQHVRNVLVTPVKKVEVAAAEVAPEVQG